jgi:hypothetical protein
MIEKSLLNLTIDDFRKFPVWEPTDDLEDDFLEVTPLEKPTSLDFEGIYFIFTHFILADGSVCEGYIKTSMGETIMLALWNNNNLLTKFACRTSDISGDYHEEFSKSFNKKISEVFPIKFKTHIVFSLIGSVI